MFSYIRNYLLSDKQTVLQLVIISVFTLLAFSNIFGNSFVIDDAEMFTNWPDVQNMNIPKLLAGSHAPRLNEKAYRPVKGIITAIDYKLWGSSPIGYHLQAILLNLAITLIIFFIIKAISRKPSIAFIGSLLFGIHPVHTEAITFMAVSLAVWGILFFFLSFYFYLVPTRPPLARLASLIFAFLAFFSYELTLTLPFIIIIYDICFKKINRQNLKRKLIIYAEYIFLFLSFFSLRLLFIGYLKGADYLAGSFYLTMLTMTKAVVKYLCLFIFPLNLSINPVLSGGIQANVTNFTNLDPIKAQSIFNFDILSSILIIAILIGIGIVAIRKRPIISFSIFFTFIALLPVLNIIPQQLIMAERYGYISSFGIALLIGFIFNFLYRKKRAQNLLIILLIIFVLFFSFLTVKRNTQWKNILSLWTALANQPVEDTIKNSYAGMVYFQKGEYERATENFKQVIDKKGDIKFANYFLTFISLNTAISQGDKKMAEKLYKDLFKMTLASDRSSLNVLKKIIDSLPSLPKASHTSTLTESPKL